MAKTIALVIAHTGFQPIEYGVTKKILNSEGYSVLTVSNKPGIATSSIAAVSANVDVPLSKLELETIDGLFLIGGSGCLENLDTPEMHEILRRFHEMNKPMGAICVAPRILARAEILTCMRATGWDEDHELGAIFKEYGVNYVHETCVVDHNIVTATDPKAAQEFAENIITLFENQTYDELEE
jgi:protease I